MADSGEIAPCPEKAAQPSGKSVNVSVQAVDTASKEEEVETQVSPRKPTYRPFVHRTVPLFVLVFIALGLVGVLEFAVRTLPSAPLKGPGAAGIVTKLPTLKPTSGSVGSRNVHALRKRQNGEDTSTATAAVSTPAENPISPSQVSETTTASGNEISLTTSQTLTTPSDTSSSISASSAAVTSSSVTNSDGSGTNGTASQTGTVGSNASVVLDGGETYSEPIITPLSSSSNDTDGGVTIDAYLPAGYAPAQGEFAYILPPNAVGTYGDSVPGIAANSSSKLNGGSPLPPQPPRFSSQQLTLASKSYNYFLGTYAPVLIAVLLRHLVTPLYRYAKLVDPFEQLTAPEGALFRDFYLLRHLGSENIRGPYQAYQRRRWNLFWTATLYASVQMLTPLASSLTQMRYSAYGTKQASSQQGIHRRKQSSAPELWQFTAGQAVWIDSIVVRVVQGLLGLIALQLIVVWYRLWTTEPSLPANPASIATLASLTGHPQTARDFSRIDQNAELRITMGRFRDRRYRLESYTTKDGIERYGLVPKGGKIRAPPPPKKEEDSPDTSTDNRSAWRRAFDWRKKGSSSAKKSTKPRSIARTDLQNLAIVTFGTGTLFAMVLVYVLTDTQTRYELFMDSQGPGPKFVLSVLALCLKSPLRALWMNTTAALPWLRLAAPKPRAGGASVRDVMQPVPVTFTPLGGLAYALRRGEWFATGLSFAAGLAAEVLIILLPGVPYTSRQLYVAAQVNWYGSLACLGLILLVTLVGWLRMARPQGRSAWPRPPVSVGVVATYVAGSKMAADFATDLKSVPPPTTRYQFREKDGRWVMDYVPENEPE